METAPLAAGTDIWRQNGNEYDFRGNRREL
jgi:hypothetical protein